jgi:uncharacterized protein (TIRG00374 family)
VSASRAVSIVFIDRLFDVVFVLLMFAGAVVALPNLPTAIDHAAILLALLCLLAVGGMVGLLQTKTKVVALVERLLVRAFGDAGTRWSLRIEAIIDGFAILHEPRPLVVASLMTIGTWALATVGAWLVLSAIWPTAPMEAAALAICLSVIGVTLVSVPAGIGIVHAAFAVAAMSFGASHEVGLAFGILGHFLTTTVTAVMGLMGLPVAKRAGVAGLERKA